MKSILNRYTISLDIDVLTNIGEYKLNFYLKCELENIPELEFIYMRRVGEYGPENKILMERFKSWLRNNITSDENTTILSIALDNPELVSPNECRYDVGMIFKDDFIENDIEEKIYSRKIRGGKYLVYLIPHNQESIQSIWINYHKVLIQKGYSQDYKRPIVERYKKSLVDNHLCELCVPII